MTALSRAPCGPEALQLLADMGAKEMKLEMAERPPRSAVGTVTNILGAMVVRTIEVLNNVLPCEPEDYWLAHRSADYVLGDLSEEQMLD